MLGFITSVRHPQNCRSYERVLRRLNETLRSVCAQTSRDFFVIVVCNEMPPQPFLNARLRYVCVPFPPPSSEKAHVAAREHVLLDKGSKYAMGLLHAQKLKPSHIMFFDADDFVHQDIAAFVNHDPKTNGWCLSDGYLYFPGSGCLYEIEKTFHTHCGTSFVIPWSLFDIPEGIPPDADQNCILKTFGKDYVFNGLGSHRYYESRFIERGVPLAPLPYRGAIYRMGHGENWSWLSPKSSWRKVPLTPILREKFHLPSNLWDCLYSSLYRLPIPWDLGQNKVEGLKRRWRKDLVKKNVFIHNTNHVV